MADELFKIVLAELQEFRRENRAIHAEIFNKLQRQNDRIRHLEIWRGYLIGLASAIAAGISLVVSWAFGRG